MLPTIKAITDLWRNDKYTFWFVSIVTLAAIYWSGRYFGWWENEALAAWMQMIGTVAAIVFSAKQAQEALVESDKRHLSQRLDQERDNYSRIQNLAALGLAEMNRLNLTLTEDKTQSREALRITNGFFVFVREQISGVSIFDLPPHQISDLALLREVTDFCIRTFSTSTIGTGFQVFNFTPNDVSHVIERLKIIRHNADFSADFCHPIFQ